MSLQILNKHSAIINFKTIIAELGDSLSKLIMTNFHYSFRWPRTRSLGMRLSFKVNLEPTLLISTLAGSVQGSTINSYYWACPSLRTVALLCLNIIGIGRHGTLSVGVVIPLFHSIPFHRSIPPFHSIVPFR